MLNFLMIIYALVVTFVLSSASRNEREMRPHGPAIAMAGEVAFSASATLAALLLTWAFMYALGFAPEPALA